MAKTQDKVMATPHLVTPFLQSKGDSSIKMIDRKTVQDITREIPIYRKMMQDITREIPIYPDPVYRAHLNQ